jgi:hypothetical protein
MPEHSVTTKVRASAATSPVTPVSASSGAAARTATAAQSADHTAVQAASASSAPGSSRRPAPARCPSRTVNAPDTPVNSEVRIAYSGCAAPSAASPVTPTYRPTTALSTSR